MQPSPEQMPHCGGNWIRTAEGALVPADNQTAHAAGLVPVPPELVPAPAEPAKTKKETKP